MNVIPMLDVLFVLVVVLLKIASEPTRITSADATHSTSPHVVSIYQGGYRFLEREYTEQEVDNLVEEIKHHIEPVESINIKPEGAISYHRVKLFAELLNRNRYRVLCN